MLKGEKEHKEKRKRQLIIRIKRVKNILLYEESSK